VKDYWSIPGHKTAVKGLPCIAFDKPDGSNIRAEWHRKRGWSKFGSRTVLLDEAHPYLGEAIPLFQNTLAEKLEKVFRENRKMPTVETAVVYMEFYGPSSFAGQHVPGEPKKLTIIDVNIHKRGIIVPRDFIKWFDGLPIPEVLYEGNFNVPFINDVREGKYGQREGVVAKGCNPKCRSEQHGLWMAKVKTKWWLDELRRLAGTNIALQKVLADNEREQEEQ
jgi:hypothetical protein